jgi:hypothetical protein
MVWGVSQESSFNWLRHRNVIQKIYLKANGSKNKILRLLIQYNYYNFCLKISQIISKMLRSNFCRTLSIIQNLRTIGLTKLNLSLNCHKWSFVFINIFLFNQGLSQRKQLINQWDLIGLNGNSNKLFLKYAITNAFDIILSNNDYINLKQSIFYRISKFNISLKVCYFC